MDLLKGQGLNNVEFLVITRSGPGWSDHAPGFEVATFPVMVDNANQGGVYDIYDVPEYTVILVDKKGRLVTTEEDFSEETVDALNRKLRDLHVE
jgi:hypothetical protein